MVDNHSEDGSYELIKANFLKINLTRNNMNMGFAGGNNVGMALALKQGFEYILLLNNDTEPAADFLGYLVDEMEISKTTAAIQPLIYYLKRKDKIWNAGGNYREWLVYSQTCYQVQDNSQPYPTDWITGCAIMVRAEVIEKLGMLDEQYFAYFEDVDWSLRMKKAGYQLKVHPLSLVYHEAGASSKSKEEQKEGFLNPKVHYLNVRNQIFQLRKHARFPTVFLAWTAHFIKFMVFALYFLLRGRKTKLAAVVKGFKDGLTTKISNNR